MSFLQRFFANLVNNLQGVTNPWYNSSHYVQFKNDYNLIVILSEIYQTLENTMGCVVKLVVLENTA